MKTGYCSSCGQEFKPGELSVHCRMCLSNYHARCWEKTGGCTTWGCNGKPELGGNREGLSYKRCPFCGEEIISFAVKCRYCRSSLLAPESKDSAASRTDGRLKDEQLKKDPILTGLLNLIFPGAGYMYLGQFGKGLTWFLIAIAAWFFTRGIGLIAVYLWVMYDSARQARFINRGGEPPDKKKVQRH